MRANEVIAECDAWYNNLSSGAAPNINLFEWSLVLTRAQNELVHMYYAGTGSRFMTFESDEEVRRYLDKLITPADINLSLPSAYGRFKNYSVLKDGDGRKVLEVVREEATVAADGCMNGSIIAVNAVRHEDLNRILNDPFKRPNERKAVRFDLGGADVKFHILSVVELASYHMDYLREPYPIILTNLESFGEDYSTIQGESLPFGYDDDHDNPVVNEIPDVLMRKVITRACELAKATYIGDLGTTFAVNARDL